MDPFSGSTTALPPTDYAGLVAIGWLETGHKYSQGEVSEEFYRRLLELLKHPWMPCALLGMHGCDLCPFQEVEMEGEMFRDTRGSPSGNLNLFIPGRGCIYAAPELIKHYIPDHKYAPPEEFCQAVLDCPAMNSDDYFEAMKRNTPRNNRTWNAAFRHRI